MGTPCFRKDIAPSSPSKSVRSWGFLSLSLVLSCLAASRSQAQTGQPAPNAWPYSADQLTPFWKADTMHGESVLFIRNPETGEARAKVLFPVKKVLAVHNSAGDVCWREGRDYRWNPGSREIVLPAGSNIPSYVPGDLRRPANTQKHRLTHRDGNGEIFFGARLEYHGMQTCITYTHAPGLWTGPVPRVEEARLPRSLRKLRAGETLSIVLTGDSISAGLNASGWAGGAPFQPPYPELLRLRLEAGFRSKVSLENMAVDGRDTGWALGTVDRIAARRPDLVVLAFGMNDSARRPPSEYQANTKAMMDKIRETVPTAEFVLVATMLGNRDWTLLRHEYFPEYRDALAALCGPGVALADLTSVWSAFLEHKQFWDLTGNGVNHPNDFGHRVYAQVISSLFIP